MIESVLILLLWLVLAGLIFYVAWWGLHKIAPPEPFMKVGEVILIVLAVIVLCWVILSIMPALPRISFRS